MEESAFVTLSDQVLERIAQRIDMAADGIWDVDFADGVLRITLPDGKVFVINRQRPNRQIWLSSPVSGAWHFDAPDWKATRSDTYLLPLLAAEFAHLLNQPVSLATGESGLT